MTSTTTGKFVIEASELDGTRQIVPKEVPVDEDADTNTVVVVSQNESAVVRNTGNGYVSRLANASTSQEV